MVFFVGGVLGFVGLLCRGFKHFLVLFVGGLGFSGLLCRGFKYCVLQVACVVCLPALCLLFPAIVDL